MDIEGLQEWMKAEFSQLRGENRGRHDLLQKDINYIKEQTTKTNGRVLMLEGTVAAIKSKQDTCPVTILERDFLKSEAIQNRIDEETKLFRMLAARPKLLQAVFVGLFLTTLVSILGMVLTFIQFGKHLL